jgi:hypothetical protein
MDSTPASYFENLGFKSRLGNSLVWLKCFLIFEQTLQADTGMVTEIRQTLTFHTLPYSLLANCPIILRYIV